METFNSLMDKFIKGSIKIYDEDGISIDILKSKNRRRRITDFRHTLMSIAYNTSGETQEKVAKYFNRKHEMVVHSRKVVETLGLNNSQYNEKYNKIHKLAKKIFKEDRENRKDVFLKLLKSKVKSERAIDYWIKRYNEAY